VDGDRLPAPFPNCDEPKGLHMTGAQRPTNT
jgi:hypothetical protein